MNDREIVYVFIDSQNLNLGVKDQGWSLDFRRFYVYLKEKYKAIRVFLFIGFMERNAKLYNFLAISGYQIVFKPVLYVDNSSHVKGNVDAELVLQAMIEYKRYDKAIIVSGDGDFYCLIKYLKTHNKLGRLIIPNRSKYSQLLQEFIKDIDFASNLKNKVEIKGEVSQPRTKP